jgi:hypothetical protein
MFTETGSWEIINTTRYSTDDIVAVFERYEDWLRRLHGEARPARNREQGQVRIGDYSPSTLTYVRTRYTPTGYASETVHCYVRGPHVAATHMRDIGLIKPTKLYTSALEALSAPTLEGAEIVPEEFVRQFVTDAVSRCYRHVPSGTVIERDFDITGLHIRVMKRRASSEPRGRSRGVQVSALRNAHNEFYWALNSLTSALSRVNEHNQGLDQRFAALQVERAVTAEMLAGLAAAIDAAQQAGRRDWNTIQKESE